MEINELFELFGIQDVESIPYHYIELDGLYIDFNNENGALSGDFKLTKEETKQLFKSMLIYYYNERIKDE